MRLEDVACRDSIVGGVFRGRITRISRGKECFSGEQGYNATNDVLVVAGRMSS